MDGISLKLVGDRHTGKAQHIVNVSSNGAPLAVRKCVVSVDWDVSGVLVADIDVILNEIDIVVDWENAKLYADWNGKRYRLVEV